MRYLLLLPAVLFIQRTSAQHTIAYQGFEGTTGCTDWGYSGGEVNTVMAAAGSRSIRFGANVGAVAHTLTMNTVDLNGHSDVRIELRHAVEFGPGPGLDQGEGFAIQVSYNGGTSWATIGRIGGFGDMGYTFNQTGGTNNASATCRHQLPNPFVFNVPAAQTSVRVRLFTTRSCNDMAQKLDRSDEFIYVDEMRITSAVPAVLPNPPALTWNGSASSDWYDCKNWTPIGVPGTLTAVTIRDGARHCSIGSSGNIAAVCASLTMEHTGNLAGPVGRQLSILTGSSLTVSNTTVIERTSPRSDSLGLVVQAGASFHTEDLYISGTRARLRARGATTVRVDGDLWVSSSALADVRNSSSLIGGDLLVETSSTLDARASVTSVRGNIQLLNSGSSIDLRQATLRCGGDIRNHASSTAFNSGASVAADFATIIMDGTGEQAIGGTAGTERYPDLRINKSAGSVTLDVPLTIATNGSLHLLSGILKTTDVELLTLQPSTTVPGASHSAYVEGPVKKEGNSPFSFPVGRNGVFRPIHISGLSGLNTGLTNSFTAEYHNNDPLSTINNINVGTGLDHISRCEYWGLLRDRGTSSPRIELSWHTPTSCGVDVVQDLRVAHFTGTAWADRGQSELGAASAYQNGWVYSVPGQSNFGFFTLASVSTVNPLPIELLTFEARPAATQVDLRWRTASERNNAGFQVERSADGSSFAPLAFVPGAGRSIQEISYSTVDLAPMAGLSYYRLKQVDEDGGSSYSPIVPVEFRTAHDLRILQEAEAVTVEHGLGESTWTLIDVAGRVVATGRAEAERFSLSRSGMPAGVLVLRVASSVGQAHSRFVH